MFNVSYYLRLKIYVIIYNKKILMQKIFIYTFLILCVIKYIDMYLFTYGILFKLSL